MTVFTPFRVAFDRILVPTDFSDVSETALSYAKSLARDSDATIALAHAWEPVNPVMPPESVWLDQFARQAAQSQELEDDAAKLHAEGFEVKIVSPVGQPLTELLKLAEHDDCDLIVMGTHGRSGIARMLFCSDTEAVFRHAHCPVLAVGPKVASANPEAWQPKDILCACDMHRNSAETAAFALQLAKKFDATVSVVHVQDAQEDGRREGAELSFDFALRELLGNSMERKMNPKYLWHVPHAGETVGKALARVATERRADLLVVGAHGAKPLQTHFGRGVAMEAIGEATCPVLVLPNIF